ncbi:MAG: hydrogenase expression/formation protein HypE, partial [Planctomycetales bacterium]|nr:hydrogenase expression/formation protein HypE [Planctomycetales bacterium]
MKSRSPQSDAASEEPAFVCPAPLADYPTIVLGHGGGGKLSADLLHNLFLPALGNAHLNALGDAAVVELPAGRLAMATDSFVVRPLVFPGGDVGSLAVHGVVNDLAMVGATPLYLSAGFILEEGLLIEQLARIVDSMRAAAARADVQIVTGDTKVVGRGHGDGCYINVTGVGRVPDGLHIGPNSAQPGDAVIASGTIGDHSMAIMSVREGLEFESEIRSDSAPLHGLVASLLAACPHVRVL